MNRLFVEVHDAELQNELINDPKRPGIPFCFPKKMSLCTIYQKTCKQVKMQKKKKKENNNNVALNPKCYVIVD